MVEPWSNHIFRAPRRISCILRGYPSIQTTSCCPSQTRRIVDLVNLQTDLGHRLYTDRIQTKYRHKCTNKLPLGCSFVFIFHSCRLVLNFDGLWSSSYQNSDVLSRSSMSEDLQSLHVLQAASVSTNYPYHVGSVLTNSPFT
ncbi:hypothetical protein HanPSC8_Chr11g0461431 [Helianthus annuus]|nr:hypothetical protein HanPSC8_Chr11g0461431 [Helianthus annuus]